MSANKLLERLQKVRRKGEGQWMACCPAHEDKSPSLSIAESRDGRVLVKCFSGCSALDVISAVGLEWDDLFPESDKHYRSLARHVGLNSSIDDRIVDLACNAKELTNKQREEAKQAALRGGKPDGFSEELAWKLDLCQASAEIRAAESFSVADRVWDSVMAEIKGEEK